jgi:transcriptional regulator of arginine metabolism
MRIVLHEVPVPHEIEHKEIRQRAILGLLRESPAATQPELVEKLQSRGIAATQSSVSRDLRELGVPRVGGRYVPPVAERIADEAPPRSASQAEVEGVARFVRSSKVAGPNLTIVLTTVGAAQPVASAMDRAAWPEVVGTLAGDDTIFVATAGARDQKRFLQRLQLLLTR